MTALRRAVAVLAIFAARSGAAADPVQGPPPGAAEDAKARDWFTDTELLTQDGTPVRFYSDVLRDRVVVIGFIFTRCAGACPIIMSKLGRVRDGLGDRLASDVRFVLVSVDSEFDTPEELKRFAEKHRASGEGWTYLTGKKENVALVLKRLGSYVEDPGEHSTGFVAGNVRTRHWVKIPPYAPPPTIVELLKGLAGEDRAPATAAAR